MYNINNQHRTTIEVHLDTFWDENRGSDFRVLLSNSVGIVCYRIT